MKYALLLLLIFASSAFAKQTETFDVILRAKLNKWENLFFKAYYGADGKVAYYQWTHESATRDRRGPGIYTENIFCFLCRGVNIDDPENTGTTTTRDDTTIFRFTYAGQNNPFSEIIVKIKPEGAKASVAISGSGPVYNDFVASLKKFREDNIREGEDLEAGLNWEFKPKN